MTCLQTLARSEIRTMKPCTNPPKQTTLSSTSKRTCGRPFALWTEPCHVFATKYVCCPTGRRSRSALRHSLPNRNRVILSASNRKLAPAGRMTSLLDILKETALRTNFPDLLTGVTSRERLPRDVLHRRLILCLYGLGTNTGFKRLPSADPGTTYSDLRYARSRYIHKEQLRNAIAHVANAIFEARLADDLGRGNNCLRLRLEEVWGLEPEFAHRVAYSLPRAWNYDLLARREKVHLHLFAAQKLLILRSSCDGRRSVAPLHQCRDSEKLR